STGMPSGASKSTASSRRRNAPTLRSMPGARACGIATAAPRPVEPSRSRAARPSRTVPASIPPAASASIVLKRSRAAFLLLTRSSRRTLPGARMAATSMILLSRAWRSAEARSRDFPGVMVGELLFVLFDLPIELVDEHIDGGVHVGLDGVGVYRAAADLYGGFGPVLQFLHREDAVDIGHVVEMPLELCELGADVIAKGRRDLDVMTGNAPLHNAGSSLRVVLTHELVSL